MGLGAWIESRLGAEMARPLSCKARILSAILPPDFVTGPWSCWISLDLREVKKWSDGQEVL